MNDGLNSYSSLTNIEPLWPKTNDRLLKRIDLLIRSNVSNALFDSNTLSENLGISMSTLNRFLKQKVDSSAARLLKNLRLEIAYRMVTQTYVPLKNISIHIGYRQQSNFTRAFIQKFGQSPTAIRMTTSQKKNHNQLE